MLNNKMIITLIASVLIMLFILTGCSNKFNWEKGFLAVVYTNSLKEKSTIVVLDDEGKEITTLNIPVRGIFEVKRTGDQELVMLGRFSDKIVRVKEDKVIIEKTHQFPFLYDKIDENRELVIYNSDPQGDIDYFSYDFRNRNHSNTIRHKGFPWALETDKKYAYVYVAQVPQKNQSIDVFDLQGHLIKSIPLNVGGRAGDVRIVDGRLIITSLSDSRREQPDQHVIVIDLDGSWEARTLKLRYPAPNHILTTSDSIVITHDIADDRSILTFLDRKTLKQKANFVLNHKVYRAAIAGDHLYTLHQIGNGGKIIVYDLKNMKQISTYSLKGRGEMMVQNFVLLK
ncbi:hypothetical protein [Thermosediminibacter oceani]|uniref:Lipoprotein n=1 Tax=Thermosediminibacter oceani (strain ATCC BAA-1034 / DSM 16646 / JW/IW-1228P) TaxID=555079 RepID=D9RYT5_THEOJ|nr:hypothetical protein [Thermosediminibacter oceani]ADL08509.1 hypothetical protein Toce_1775 [Thermosediminibacter oceani DSM 16646]